MSSKLLETSGGTPEQISASTSSSPARTPSLTLQRLQKKGSNDILVLNSPYGPERNTMYGWGTLFRPPMSAVIPGHPHIHIGISSLNGVPTVGKSDRSMRSLLSQYRKKFNCLEHCYPYHRVGDTATWQSWADMVKDSNVVKSDMVETAAVPSVFAFAPSSTLSGQSRSEAVNTSMNTTDTSASSRRVSTVNANRFLYTIKANNLLTHVKQLLMRDSEVQEHVQTFFHERCPELEPFLGPILVQLPPSFCYSKINVQRLTELHEQITTEEVLLREFLDAPAPSTSPAAPIVSALPHRRIRIAVEFRNHTWFRQETFDLLRSFRWALVVAHHHDDPTFSTVVDTGAGFLYFRLHGPLGRSVGDYGSLAMKLWAEEIVHYLQLNGQDAQASPAFVAPKEVFVFLNNSDSNVGGTTSSTVDATCLAEHLRQLLLSSADRPSFAHTTQTQRSATRAAAATVTSQTTPAAEPATRDTDAVETQTVGTTSVVPDCVVDEDDTAGAPPAKRLRTSTQSGASRDDEVVID